MFQLNQARSVSIFGQVSSRPDLPDGLVRAVWHVHTQYLSSRVCSRRELIESKRKERVGQWRELEEQTNGLHAATEKQPKSVVDDAQRLGLYPNSPSQTTPPLGSGAKSGTSSSNPRSFLHLVGI